MKHLEKSKQAQGISTSDTFLIAPAPSLGINLFDGTKVLNNASPFAVARSSNRREKWIVGPKEHSTGA